MKLSTIDANLKIVPEILGYEVRVKCECGTELYPEIKIDYHLKQVIIQTEKCIGCYNKSLEYNN